MLNKNKPPKNVGKHTTVDRQIDMFEDIDGYIDRVQAGGPTSIFLAVVRNINLKFHQWTTLLKEWENCPSSGIRNTKSDRTHARSNLNKDLLNPNITWDVMVKLFKAIRVTRIEINIKCEFNWRKPTEVKVAFDTGVPKPLKARVLDASYSESAQTEQEAKKPRRRK